MNRYAIPLFFILLSVGVYIEYIDPTIAAIQVDRAKSAEYTKYILEAGEAQSQIEALKQKQQDFPPGYDQALATILPANVDPTKLIIDIDGIAQLRGLTIKSPSAKVSAAGTGSYAKNTISFGVSAPYTVFRAFLRDMESSLALRDAAAVSFSSVSSDDTNGIKNPELKAMDYTLTIITYSRGS